MVLGYLIPLGSNNSLMEIIGNDGGLIGLKIMTNTSGKLWLWCMQPSLPWLIVLASNIWNRKKVNAITVNNAHWVETLWIVAQVTVIPLELVYLFFLELTLEFNFLCICMPQNRSALHPSNLIAWLEILQQVMTVMVSWQDAEKCVIEYSLSKNSVSFW